MRLAARRDGEQGETGGEGARTDQGARGFGDGEQGVPASAGRRLVAAQDRSGFRPLIADRPVIARPTISACTESVPSKVKIASMSA